VSVHALLAAKLKGLDAVCKIVEALVEKRGAAVARQQLAIANFDTATINALVKGGSVPAPTPRPAVLGAINKPQDVFSSKAAFKAQQRARAEADKKAKAEAERKARREARAQEAAAAETPAPDVETPAEKPKKKATKKKKKATKKKAPKKS